MLGSRKQQEANKDIPIPRGPKLELDGLDDIREGVYANIALARTSPKESIIDFAFIDSNEQEGGQIVTRGKFQARVIMSNTSMLELRDMLNKHIEQNAHSFPMARAVQPQQPAPQGMPNEGGAAMPMEDFGQQQ